MGDLYGKNVRRRPTLPQAPACSTIGADGLNFRVRNGAGCFPIAMTAETLWSYVGPRKVPDRNSGATQWTRNIVERQALGLLVPVGSEHYCLLPPAYQPSVLLGALPG